MKWKVPPKIKVYEALGCIGDKRIEIINNKGKVFSSSRNKFYSIEYNESKNAIMCNDNGSYWQGYLGYPSIAFLMLSGKIKFNEEAADAFRGIPWKDVNTKFGNNYEKTEAYVLNLVQERGYDEEKLLKEVTNLFQQVRELSIGLLGNKTIPPKGY